jgi:TPR repeat protein
MYYRGMAVTQDIRQAEEWFLKAAVQGNAGSQNNLGVLYELGDGVQRNYSKAVKWYT